MDLEQVRLHLNFDTLIPFPQQENSMTDYLFRGALEKLDKDVYELTQLEAER